MVRILLVFGNCKSFWSLIGRRRSFFVLIIIWVKKWLRIFLFFDLVICFLVLFGIGIILIMFRLFLRSYLVLKVVVVILMSLVLFVMLCRIIFFRFLYFLLWKDLFFFCLRILEMRRCGYFVLFLLLSLRMLLLDSMVSCWMVVSFCIRRMI